jgi:hypothetical protein
MSHYYDIDDFLAGETVRVPDCARAFLSAVLGKEAQENEWNGRSG